ncbi:MAG: M13 family metallopeptidase [Labilithrix sp.]|nr:M13 family metallopeptidase [Labilithrix sp.]MCW5809399.1 M13 family metallopeptidase [Labilithrix sp.]
MIRSSAVSSVLILAAVACGDSTPPPVTPENNSAAEAKAAQPPVSTYNGKPKLGKFGVDTAGMDTSVKPGADFYQYAGGTWMKENQIPADKSKWGMFDQLREESDGNVHKILEEIAKAKNEKGSNAQKIGDYYATYLDTDAIEKKGLAPAKPGLDAIAAAKNINDIAKLMARPDLPLPGPIGMGVTLDQKNPDRCVVHVGAGGLGMPDKEYYSNEKFKTAREKYEQHIANVLAFSHEKKKDAKKDAADAKAVMALETKIAELHWARAARREKEKMYNPKSVADLQKDAAKFPWKLYMDTIGYGDQKDVIVGELDAIPKLADLFASTPVATWKAYLTFHFLRASADVLPKALDQEVFEFSKVLSGQPQQRERWKRAVSSTNGALGEAVGEIYVQRYFQPKAKAEMDRLIENIRKAYGIRIEGNDWMTAETKKAALEKLAAFRPKIAFPVKWKNYSSLEVVAGDAWGNDRKASLWHHEYKKAKLGKPTDKDEWSMTPQTVNAYYNPVFNEIVFPAAILQAPFFDPEADAAVNYGGIGSVIGHEMGHGFDDQGSKSDAKGVLRNWWAPADLEAFKKRTDALADQYSQYEPLPGVKVNGRLTLGENIGDLGGSNVAYKAYQLSLDGKPAGTIDGFTGDQRFFLGYAQVWRSVYRDEALKNQVTTDPHSPAMYRTNGIVRNHDAWYKAFDVKESDALYLAPEKRVKIW